RREDRSGILDTRSFRGSLGFADVGGWKDLSRRRRRRRRDHAGRQSEEGDRGNKHGQLRLLDGSAGERSALHLQSQSTFRIAGRGCKQTSHREKLIATKRHKRHKCGSIIICDFCASLWLEISI